MDNKKTILNNLNKYNVILTVILLTGFLARLLFIGRMPFGLNQDEASAGYDAYSILHYGIDRNGISYPVFLKAWGSGQNALYSYFCMPFIALFGLSELSLRLPMALIGCVSVFVIYRLSKIMFDEKYALIITGFFAICPWHVMKSRWALESNLFFFFFFIVVYLIALYIKDNSNKKSFVIAAFILGLSAYSYGTAYLFIPLFAVGVAVLLIAKKKVSFSVLIVAVAVAFFTALPIVMFVIINTFDMEQMKFFMFTIPKLNVSRHMEISSVFSHDFFKTTWENFRQTLRIMCEQNDDLIWNSTPFYGTMYTVSLPFTVTGAYVLIKNIADKKSDVVKRVTQAVVVIWLCAAFIVSVAVLPNVNRINVIMIPLALCTGTGIAFVVNNIKELRRVILGLYSLLFISFSVYYLNDYQESVGNAFFYGLGDAIEYAGSLDASCVYVMKSINMPYIFTLFYDTSNPNEYIKSVVYENKGGAFEKVEQYGEYKFMLPLDNGELENVAIIVTDGELAYYENSNYKLKSFGLYNVLFID